ncbi:MbcA/ParS/Xre antitoxin family protein [Terasakiella sp.]|uniref:MbcA/ParS/Xre antitoxin family protein n=1 Tax=Terasakiella sp. TaxID=2034861 RepID=UPI003AA96A2A
MTNANAALNSAQSRKMMSGAGLRTFFNIADLWKLTGKECMTLLGVTNESTYYKWKKNPDCCTLARDTLERLSYILGIYKALQILLPREDAADDWIKKPNNAPLFNGRSALDRMLSGNVVDLFIVRQYLDAQRGGI